MPFLNMFGSGTTRGFGFRMGGVPSAPGTPTASLPATYGNTTASVAWTAPTSDNGSPIFDYTIQYSDNGGSTWTTFSDTVSTSTSVTVTGLTNGNTYVFRVAAINGIGTGTYSASSNSVTPLEGKLPTPTANIDETTSTIPICYTNYDASYTYVYYDYNFAPNNIVGSCQGWSGLGENQFRETYVKVTKFGWADSDGAYFSETTNVTPPDFTPACTCCYGATVTEYRCVDVPQGLVQQVRTGTAYNGTCGASGGSGPSCSGACAGCSCPAYTDWGAWTNTGNFC
jgi:hypothetical protein